MKCCKYCSEPYGFMDRISNPEMCSKCFNDPKRIESYLQKNPPEEYPFRSIKIPARRKIRERLIGQNLKDTISELKLRTCSIGTNGSAMRAHMTSEVDLYLAVFSGDQMNFTLTHGATGYATIDGQFIEDGNYTTIQYWPKGISPIGRMTLLSNFKHTLNKK